MINDIKNKLNNSSDYIFREILVDNLLINIIFSESLTNSFYINKLIYFLTTSINKNNIINLYKLLPYSKVLIIKKNDILYYLNNGFVVINYNDIIYCIEVKANIDRGVPSISSELSISGAKDSFSENININMGLIRRRIKSNLCDVSLAIGVLSKTNIRLLYIDSICSKKLVDNVVNKLKRINIDGIIDSSYLKYSLEDSFNLFPTIMMSERPDKCSMSLLEGKVIILVDTSPYALILPSFFIDFFHTPDDYYQKSINTSFIRIIRLLAFLIAIFTPAIYISVTTRNYNLIPVNLLLVLKSGRSYVPFPAYIESLFMIICFEILKEGDLRKSSSNSSAISILGGLILGDAAVSASIVSPIMIIIIAISSIAGLIFQSYELSNAIRNYKLFLLLLSSLLGINGVIIGLIIMIYNIYMTKVFGYSYLSIDFNELKDSFIRINTNLRRRNSKLTNNKIRGYYK